MKLPVLIGAFMLIGGIFAVDPASVEWMRQQEKPQDQKETVFSDFISDDELNAAFDSMLANFIRQNLFHYPAKMSDFMELGEPLPPKPYVRTFIDDVADTFRMIETQSPELFRKLEARDRAQLLTEILRAVESGVIPAAALQGKTAAKAAPAAAPHYSPKLICRNRLLYLRIGDLSAPELSEELLAVSRLMNQPHGVILDLRQASGKDPQAALELLAIFSAPEQMKPFAVAGKRLFDLPMAVLIDSGTSGSPEILVSLAEKMKLGISLGKRTAGHPVAFKPGESVGLQWEIPDLPYAEIEPHAHMPAIELDTEPRISFADLGKCDEFARLDPCLSRAADLLLSLDALKKRNLIRK